MLALTLCQSQQLPFTPVRKLVIVSSREIAETTKSNTMLSSSAEEAIKHLDKGAFTILKSKNYTFLVETNVLAADLLRSQRVMFEAMEAALKGGSRRIDLSKMPPAAQKAVSEVLRAQIDYIDVGLRHLIDRPDLKVDMMPEVVVQLEGGGKTRMVAASSPLDQRGLATGPSTENEVANQAPSNPPSLAPQNALRFYFSIDFSNTRTARLKAMSQFGLLMIEELAKDYAAADAAYERLRSLLLEEFGGEPSKTKDVSQLPKQMQEALARDIGNSFKFEGFDTRLEAESWLYGSRVVSTNSYISIGFGGYDRNQKQVVFGIIPLKRP